MYPFTLGANIGTTVTGLLAAGASGSSDSLQVALAHLFFNVTGILIFYPIPFMRRIPLGMARQLGKYTRIWRGFPFLYIAIAFFLIPIILLGFSYLLSSDSIGAVSFGVVLVIMLASAIAKWAYYWTKQDGRAITIAYFERRQRNSEHRNDLPENMEYLLEEVKRLKEFTGIPEQPRDDDDAEMDVAPADEKAVDKAEKPVEDTEYDA
jgi:solute carrier family 34 (sodium-dependent phosphate cotransporter)